MSGNKRIRFVAACFVQRSFLPAPRFGPRDLFFDFIGYQFIKNWPTFLKAVQGGGSTMERAESPEPGISP